MSEQLALDQNELTEAQTHINLIQKAYRKLESAQYAARELENDFRDLINTYEGRVSICQPQDTAEGSSPPQVPPEGPWRASGAKRR